MELAGLQKLTLLDDPGHVACTVFVQGCNFCCPFCHNSELIPLRAQAPTVTVQQLLSFLEKRKGILDSVCLTGGEPLLWPETRDLLCAVKERGYRVKLDTNGSFPQRLEQLVKEGLLDCVAMDVKNSPDRYAETTGCGQPPLEAVRASAAFLLSGAVECEFRTTVARELHDEQALRDIGQWLAGAQRYYLQNFVPAPQVPDKRLTPFDRAGLHALLAAVRPFVPNAKIRGE